MSELIAELLILFESFKFWKKKNERRQLEKDEKLPRKRMVHPTIWILFIGIALIICIRFVSELLFADRGISLTTNKIIEIEEALIREKESVGKYPLELKDIIRNNPLRKGMIVDAWGNEFHYEQLNNGLGYILRSKGKDGQLNTDDDILSKK